MRSYSCLDFNSDFFISEKNEIIHGFVHSIHVHICWLKNHILSGSNYSVQDDDHILDNVIAGTAFALYLLAGVVNSLLLVFLSATLICVYLAVSGFIMLRKNGIENEKKNPTDDEVRTMKNYGIPGLVFVLFGAPFSFFGLAGIYATLISIGDLFSKPAGFITSIDYFIHYCGFYVFAFAGLGLQFLGLLCWYWLIEYKLKSSKLEVISPQND